MKKLLLYIWNKIKFFALQVGIPRCIIAFVIALALLYCVAIYGLIVGKYWLIPANIVFWFSGGTPAIPIGILIGIGVLILISPKSKKAILREELKKTWLEIKQAGKDVLEKVRRWVRGD